VSLYSTQGLAVFADYQLLAAMGHLLNYLKEAHAVDAEPLEVKPFLLFPTKLAPLNLTLPDVSPKPIVPANPAAAPVNADLPVTVNPERPVTYPAGPGPKVIAFNERWNEKSGPQGVLTAIASWFTDYSPSSQVAANPVDATSASAYAAETPRTDIPVGWTSMVPARR
jgi:outer membrane protein, adhesin transport system